MENLSKVWVLREIISELEVQVASRSEREEALEQRLAELEAELDAQTRKQADMLSELQGLRGCGDHALQQELCSLQSKLHKEKHNSPAVVRQIRSQVRVQLLNQLDQGFQQRGKTRTMCEFYKYRGDLIKTSDGMLQYILDTQ